MSGRAKGTNLLHMFTFVERRAGPEGWERVLAHLDPEDAARVRVVVPVRWYDLSLQHRVLRAINLELGEGDGELVDAVARYEADQDLTVVHRMFLRVAATPAFIMERSRDYWDRFYDVGAWTVERVGDKHSRGVLRGVRPFDPFFARYLHAYIVRMFELTGAKYLSSRYRIVDLASDPKLVLEGRWR